MPPATRQSTAPKQPAPHSAASCCQHKTILVRPSQYAAEVGYHQPSREHRAKVLGVDPAALNDKALTFPAPMVLPGDDLALDPTYPEQSLQSCIGCRPHHSIQKSSSRNPGRHLRHGGSKKAKATATASPPNIDGVAEYVRAFYHPLPVKVLPASTLNFVSWSVTDTEQLQAKQTQTKNQPTATSLIGLRIPHEIVGISTRATPNYAYPRQLNLNDVLDAAIAMLPADAYALLMLVDQDMYEDDDDEFVCGRAYGGSRISVVSTARYNPALDEVIGLDLEHVWPMSHCERFVKRFVTEKATEKRKLTNTTKTIESTDADNDHSVVTVTENSTSSPLEAAINTTRQFRSSSTMHETPSARWSSRLLRTAVHELAHCVGLDHCVFYACVMQGSASILEDHRQPPYLCPVDLAKVLTATRGTEEKHLRALMKFCQRCMNGEGKNSISELVVAMEAWLRVRLDKVVASKSSIVELMTEASV